MYGYHCVLRVTKKGVQKISGHTNEHDNCLKVYPHTQSQLSSVWNPGQGRKKKMLTVM